MICRNPIPFIWNDLKNGLGCAVTGNSKNWKKQFEQLLSQQQQEICVEALHASAEGNRYFWFSATWLTNYVFALPWILERLTDYFQNEVDFIIDGEAKWLSTAEFYDPDSEYSDIDIVGGISSYTGFDELPNNLIDIKIKTHRYRVIQHLPKGYQMI